MVCEKVTAMFLPRFIVFYFLGILERPPIPANIEEVCYKLFFVGKSGVGKTTSIARLAGTNVSSSYVETCGIRKTDIYWPVKIWDKTVLFKLQCWDAGDNSLKKYSHVLPVSLL